MRFWRWLLVCNSGGKGRCDTLQQVYFFTDSCFVLLRFRYDLGCRRKLMYLPELIGSYLYEAL